MQLARKTLALLLCCCLSPAMLLAQEAGAMLYPTGQVTVNGHPAANSTALFPGDKVQTGPDSAASITANGGSAQIGADSSVIWQPQAIQFQAGSLTVVAQAPWQVHIAAMTVSLGAEATKVEVTQREDVALIKLLSGSATLTEGGQTTALKVDFTVARPNPAGNAPGPVAVAKHKSNVGIILLVVGAGAAAGAGLGLRGKGSSTTPQPISPSVP